MNGYRKMISDNIPLTWDLGLRWCKCRLRWIEYVYVHYIKPYDNDYRSKKEIKRLKSRQAKFYCGKLKNENGHKLTFDLTINMHTLLIRDKEQYDYWTTIIKWVNWFSKNTLYLKSMMSNMQYSSDDEIADYIQTHCKLKDRKLVEFIVKNIRYAD